jgi:hypothetical protein
MQNRLVVNRVVKGLYRNKTHNYQTDLRPVFGGTAKKGSSYNIKKYFDP